MAKRGRPKKRKVAFKLKKGTIASALALSFFALAVFIIISFSHQTAILKSLNEIIFSYLGWEIYLSPLLLILAGLLLSRLKTPLTSFSVFFGAFLMFFSLAGLTRAGRVGSFLLTKVSSLLGLFGAYVLFLVLSLVGLVVLLDTSIEEIVRFIARVLKVVKRYIAMPKEKSKKGESPLIKESSSEEFALDNRPIKMPSRSFNLDASYSPPNKKGGERERKEEIVPAVPGARTGVWRYPPLSLLDKGSGGKADRGDIKKNASIIEENLESFGVSARVIEVNPGPAVTQYAIRVAQGTKLSKIMSLANDLALALAAPTGQIRIEAPIPGRSLAGIELPNRSLEVVTLRRILSSPEMKKTKSKLAVGLGLDVSGKPVIADIAKMPHVLIAGQTGSGKSVLLNSWLASLLFRTTPEEVKLLLVDPKRVELTQYEGIPHLLSSVIVEPKKVVSSLKWAVKEMERRYKLFNEAGVRNIDSYNEAAGFSSLPYILIFIDELADIMFFSPSEVEASICRLAQMARATGIHLIIATQRPSVDVLTGLIKANIPCRISCAVASLTDSRVILDSPGAEKLLGRGDMLYLPPDKPRAIRVQGTYVSERETRNLINFLKNNGVEPVYTEEVLEMPVGKEKANVRLKEGGRDELFDEAVKIIYQFNKASASLLQRRLRIGYNRAAAILDQMEAAGIVGPAKGSKPRQILSPSSGLAEENKS